MPGSRVEVKGADRLASKLRGMARRAENVEPGLARVPEVLERHVDRTFSTRGGSIGMPWEPLSGPYVAWKLKSGSRTPLVLTGSLRDSFSPGSRWHIQERRPNGITWGTKAPHARLHQAGTAGGQMPARPILIVTRELRAEVRQHVRDYVLRG